MSVSTERRGRSLVIRIEREAKRNAIDPETTAGLDAALNTLDDDPELWVGILTGGPSVFSAGSDLRLGSGEPTARGGEYGVIRRDHAKPRVAAVEGLAFGGGMEIVLACDLVVAGRSARFALPMLTGDPISAERAAGFGFVNVLCEDGRALDEALALGERIAANAPVAVRESLRVLEQTAAALEDVGWQLSADAAKAIFSSEDAREGRDAFLEKRAPVWRNR